MLYRFKSVFDISRHTYFLYNHIGGSELIEFVRTAAGDANLFFCQLLQMLEMWSMVLNTKMILLI